MAGQPVDGPGGRFWQQIELSRKYSDKIASLPQGTVSIKKRHNSDYFYLACRRDGKVRFDYIGPAGSDKARQVMEQVKSSLKALEEKGVCCVASK